MLVIYSIHTLGYLHYYMLQNKQSHRHIIQYDVSGCIICTSNKLEYLDKRVTKIEPKKFYC